jgi:hypothetical protein
MTESAWRSRIVGHGEERVDQMVLNPWNWKIHPKAQLEGLRGAIIEVGFVRSVTVNRRTGNLVDGHARVLLADREHQLLIPVEYVDLSEEEERRVLLTIDPLGALAEAQEAKLQELLQRTTVEEEGLELVLAELWERHIGERVMAPAPTEASYRENPMEHVMADRTGPPAPPGRPGVTDANYDGEGQAIRVITVYCTAAEYEETLRQVDALRERWGTETTTNTVLEVLRRAGATTADPH